MLLAAFLPYIYTAYTVLCIHNIIFYILFDVSKPQSLSQLNYCISIHDTTFMHNKTCTAREVTILNLAYFHCKPKGMSSIKK